MEEIDELNILQATLLAMRRAVEGLRLKPPKWCWSTATACRCCDVLAEAIVKGDALVPAISAASILAKVTRDRWCAELDAQYPPYGFAKHKGYGTAEHLAALQAHGACPEHRTTFRAGDRGAAREGSLHELHPALASARATTRLLKELRKLAHGNTAYRKAAARLG